MKEPDNRLRPEALPPVRSALPILLALATALLAGATGGFLMATALPRGGEPPAAVTPARAGPSLLERLFEPVRIPPCTKASPVHLLGVRGLKAL
jgi:hypothetical protein